MARQITGKSLWLPKVACIASKACVAFRPLLMRCAPACPDTVRFRAHDSWKGAGYPYQNFGTAGICSTWPRPPKQSTPRFSSDPDCFLWVGSECFRCDFIQKLDSVYTFRLHDEWETQSRSMRYSWFCWNPIFFKSEWYVFFGPKKNNKKMKMPWKVAKNAGISLETSQEILLLKWWKVFHGTWELRAAISLYKSGKLNFFLKKYWKITALFQRSLWYTYQSPVLMPLAVAETADKE